MPTKNLILPIVLLLLSPSCHALVEIPDESPARTDADGDGDSDGDTDIDGDGDGDGDSDSDPSFDCELTGDYICRGHSEMVRIPGGGFCIDRYEASRGGGDASKSLPGEFPWVNVSFQNAKIACEDQYKRLCTVSEWQKACQGPLTKEYPYGDDYQSQSCNGADYESTIFETGWLESCEGGYDCIFDMSGNVDEWVDGDCPGTSCQVFGGTYRSQQNGLKCTSSFSTSPDGGDDIGFRCCVDD